MRNLLIVVVISALLVGGVLFFNRRTDPRLTHFRPEMAKNGGDPVAQREAVTALRAELQQLARAESAFVADSGRPTRSLPDTYGYKTGRGNLGPYLLVQPQGWTASLTNARTGMTCTVYAGLDVRTRLYIPGQPHCFSEIGAAFAETPIATPPPMSSVPLAPVAETAPADPALPTPRKHRDWGPINNTPPPLPYVVKNACEGEGCSSSGFWAACSTLVARSDKRIDAPAVFTIAPQERFTAVTADVHVVVPGMVVFRDTISNPGDEGGEPVDSIRFVPADTLYILNYIGEGYLWWWYRGQAVEGYQFWSDEHASGPYSRDVVSIRSQKSVWWVRVRNLAGKEGWIVGDYEKFATGGYMDEIERCLQPAKR